MSNYTNRLSSILGWLKAVWRDLVSFRLARISWRSLRQQPLFPFFLVWLPVISLYSQNIAELESKVLWFPLAGLTLVMCVLLALFRLVYGSWYKSAVATSVVVLLNFSFSYLVGLFPDEYFAIGPITLSGNRIVLPLLGLVLLVALVWLWRTRRTFASTAPVLNGACGLVLVLVMVQAVWVEVSRVAAGTQPVAHTNVASAADAHSSLGYDPDVYYLVFDRYAGEKTLSDDYDYDNGPFLDSLKERGFYVADQSAANYPFTALSLTSSLDMNYHESVAEDAFPYPDLATSIYPRLQDTKVDAIFHQLGYKVYQMGSWFPPTHASKAADGNYAYSQLLNGMDNFSNMLLMQMAATPVVRTIWPGPFAVDNKDDHLDNLYFQEKMFPTVASLPGPKFVFVHMLMPHTPYVVDDQCVQLPDGVADSRPEMENYIAQLECANKQMSQMVDKILAVSEQKPIIIVQGDEGPYTIKYRMRDSAEFKNASDDSILERSRILNAYYLPDGDTEGLYRRITPVNSFRLIFSKYFGLDYPNVGDKTYIWPSRPKMFSYTEVTDMISRGWDE